MTIDDYLDNGCSELELDPATQLSIDDNWRDLSKKQQSELAEKILQESDSISGLALTDQMSLLKLLYDPSCPSRDGVVSIYGEKILIFYNESLEKAQGHQKTLTPDEEGHYSKENMAERTAILLRFRGSLFFDLYGISRRTNNEDFGLLDNGIASLEMSLKQNYNNSLLRARTYAILALGLENKLKFQPEVANSPTVRKRLVKKVRGCYSKAIKILEEDKDNWSNLISKYQANIEDLDKLKEKRRKNKGNLRGPKKHKKKYAPTPVSRAYKRNRFDFGRD
jgi:hypothetical protein